MEGKTKANEEIDFEFVRDNEWMIRPCEFYKYEYKDCTKIAARFHQYFIKGECENCNSWKRDHVNCEKWMYDKNIKSMKELVESEKLRRAERLAPHINNDVWKKRDAPPQDWNKPLPESISKDYEHTFLYKKAQEVKDEEMGTLVNTRQFCVIS